jgi:hypothetical protein
MQFEFTSVSTQIYSALVLFNNEYDPKFAHAWIVCRVVFVLIGFVQSIWLFKSVRYQQELNWTFLAKNKKLYGMVILSTVLSILI